MTIPASDEPLAVTYTRALMSTALLDLATLRVWPGCESIPDGDPFAEAVIEAASAKVRAVGVSTWDMATAPVRAKQIAWHLAARSYLNPGSVARENIGPIGEGRVEELARAMHLTAAEEGEILSLKVSEVGDTSGGALWIQPLRITTPVTDRDIVIGNIVYGHEDDSYAFEPEV